VTILSLPTVTGDVDAEARLVVTPDADVDWVAWGLEYLNQTGADLLLNTPDLTITGFAGTSTTRAGSNSTNIFRGTLTTSPVAVCGTGSQPHVGVYRIYARLWASGLGVRARMTYREGDGPTKSLEWETPPAANGWVELDLGVITVPAKLLGTQRWKGQIEAYSSTAGDTLDVDYLILMPAGEGFGRARREITFETSTTFSARDEFDQSAGALTGKTAPVGGVWAGAGDTDDFQVNATSHTITRAVDGDADANTGRYGVSGVAGFAAQAAQVDFTLPSMAVVNPDNAHFGVLARYTDVNNWLMATLVIDPSTALLKVRKRVASTVSTIASLPVSVNFGSSFTFRLQVDAAGRYFLWWGLRGTTLGSPVIGGQDTVLATGGALASGKPGLYDAHVGVLGVASTRSYDNFLAFVPAGNAVAFANQSIEFRSDDTVREDSTGTYWGRPPEYRGAPFFVPPAGDKNRTSRVVVMARKNDVQTMPNPTVGVNVTVGAFYTPRRLYLPR
jgi:hypothetical protein